MAGRGPAPSGQRSRERDNHKLEEIEYTGELFGEPLPEGMLGEDEDGNPIPWHPQTVKWWDSLRRNPLLANEPEIGWQFLMDTALIHNQMWTNRRWEFAAEIRLRVAKYGATPEDRMRLKIKITTPVDKEQKAKAPKAKDELAERRKRLGA